MGLPNGYQLRWLQQILKESDDGELKEEAGKFLQMHTESLKSKEAPAKDKVLGFPGHNRRYVARDNLDEILAYIEPTHWEPGMVDPNVLLEEFEDFPGSIDREVFDALELAVINMCDTPLICVPKDHPARAACEEYLEPFMPRGLP